MARPGTERGVEVFRRVAAMARTEVLHQSEKCTPIADTKGYVATHGSPWDYDRRVPILFWRPGASAIARPDSAGTTDIMPTLAAMIGVGVEPSAIDGRCLDGVPGASCPGN